jgi:cysteine synthase B
MPAARGMEARDRSRARAVRAGRLPDADQSANPDNWRAHHETTGPEIWKDGRVGHHFVSAMGTTGRSWGCRGS